MPDLREPSPTEPSQIEPSQTTERRRKDASARAVTARGILVIGARAVTGLIGIAATAAVVLAATALPLPHYQSAPVGTSVVPVASGQQRACAGPVLRLGDEAGGNATTASAIGVPQLKHLAEGGTVNVTSIANTDEPNGHSASVLTLSPAAESSSDGLSPLLAGSQIQAVSSGDTVGIAAAECREPRAETWLVGGSTDTGRTTLLSLANPGTVAATVSIAIFSESGEVQSPGTDGIVVQPGSEMHYSLAGFAPGIAQPVVHVSSVGGGVVASLQQTTVRVLEAGGFDIIGPAAAPATKVVIPGMVVRGHDATETLAGTPGFDDLTPVLRMFVPGDQGASARISVSPEGEGEPISVDFDLRPGVVSELPFDHFENGRYTVTISADVPLVAGVRASTVAASTGAQPGAGERGNSDFAWFASAERMRGQALVAIGSGAEAVLHLVNGGEDATSVALAELDGAGKTTDSVTVDVPAGRAVAVPVTANMSYRLSGFSALRISVSYEGEGLLTGFTLTPTGPAAAPITVFP